MFLKASRGQVFACPREALRWGDADLTRSAGDRAARPADCRAAAHSIDGSPCDLQPPRRVRHTPAPQHSRSTEAPAICSRQGASGILPHRSTADRRKRPHCPTTIAKARPAYSRTIARPIDGKGRTAPPRLPRRVRHTPAPQRARSTEAPAICSRQDASGILPHRSTADRLNNWRR